MPSCTVDRADRGGRSAIDLSSVWEHWLAAMSCSSSFVDADLHDFRDSPATREIYVYDSVRSASAAIGRASWSAEMRLSPSLGSPISRRHDDLLHTDALIRRSCESRAFVLNIREITGEQRRSCWQCRCEDCSRSIENR